MIINHFLHQPMYQAEYETLIKTYHTAFSTEIMIFIASIILVGLIFVGLFRKHRGGWGGIVMQIDIARATIIFILICLILIFVDNKQPYRQRENYIIEKNSGEKITKTARCLIAPNGMSYCEIDDKVYKVKSFEITSEPDFPEY